MQRVTPMISYEDCDAAAAWLGRVFGFRELARYDWQGRVAHVDMAVGEDGAVMLGWPGADYRSPKTHRAECKLAERMFSVPFVVDGAHVVVDDVDAHFERAKTEGATILSEPEDQPFGERIYVAEDLEGHRWMFAQHLGDR